MASRPASVVLVAFALIVVIGGSNAVAVRVVVADMTPMWAAAARFVAAGALLALLMVAQRKPLPRGTNLVGTLLFGTLATGLAYLFMYQALQTAPAGTAMLVVAIVPLLTIVLAALQRIEPLRPRGVAGAVIAAAGILIVALDQLSLDIPLSAIVMLLAAAVCMAESGVVAKRYPPGDPVPANAIGMLIGGAICAAAAVVAGESLAAPTTTAAWLSMLYLIVPGSVGLFILILFVLARWTVSATSYAFLLFPLVAIALGAALLQEPVRPSFLLGAVVVVVGVYIGAVHRPRAAVEGQPVDGPRWVRRPTARRAPDRDPGRPH